MINDVCMKPEETKKDAHMHQKDVDEIRKEKLELFKKNIFLIVANEQRILADDRLGFSLVSTHLGNCYCGVAYWFSLREYLRLWKECPEAVLFDEGERMKFVYSCGGGLSGGWCAFANENGEDPNKDDYFRSHVYSSVYSKVMEIVKSERNQKPSAESLPLTEVIDILKRETSEADYASNIERFKQMLLAQPDRRMA